MSDPSLFSKLLIFYGCLLWYKLPLTDVSSDRCPQMCRVYGYRSVNIVRARDDLDDLKEYLSSLGATVILTEEELR